MSGPKAKVVILGGGPAGVHLAQLLHKLADVTLVDRKDYYEINWATVRAHVQPDLANEIFIPYKEIPRIGTFIQAEVASVQADCVLLDRAMTMNLSKTSFPMSRQANDDRLPYDFLAICTGGSYPGALHQAGLTTSIADRKAGIQAGNRALQNAGSVLIVGAGPAGVETAAEIAKAVPGKLVTLVGAQSSVLGNAQGAPPALAQHVEGWLRTHGVKVILDERVDKAADGAHITDKGTNLHADVVYLCSGSKPNTKFMEKEFAACLDEKRRIKVDTHLRVVGSASANIFAVGDCNDVPETKLGFLAREQAKVVAASIKVMLKQPQGVTIAPRLEVYVPYNGNPKVLIISLGRKHGAMHVNNVVITHMLPRIKSKHLFIGHTRKQLGLDKSEGMFSCARTPNVNE